MQLGNILALASDLDIKEIDVALAFLQKRREQLSCAVQEQDHKQNSGANVVNDKIGADLRKIVQDDSTGTPDASAPSSARSNTMEEPSEPMPVSGNGVHPKGSWGKKKMSWGDSPPPGADDDDLEQPQPQKSRGNALAAIIEEQQQESDHYAALDYIEFGNGCRYYFRGESDPVRMAGKRGLALIDQTKLYINGLPDTINDEYVRGQLRGVLNARDQPTKIYVQRSEGYAFLTFKDHNTASRAYKVYTGELKANALRKIKVNFVSKTKQ